MKGKAFQTSKASSFFSDHRQSIDAYELRISKGSKNNSRFYPIINVTASSLRLKKIVIGVDKVIRITIFPGTLIDFRKRS